MHQTNLVFAEFVVHGLVENSRVGVSYSKEQGVAQVVTRVAFHKEMGYTDYQNIGLVNQLKRKGIVHVK